LSSSLFFFENVSSKSKEQHHHKKEIMADSKVQVYFDKEYKIRLLDPTKFEKGEQLEKECGTFVEKIGSFNEKVHTLVEILEAHATKIDAQKLRVSCCHSSFLWELTC
jgi:hypothetical protein